MKKRTAEEKKAAVLNHESRQSLFLLYASLRADARKRKAICKKKGYFFLIMSHAGAFFLLDASLRADEKKWV